MYYFFIGFVLVRVHCSIIVWSSNVQFIEQNNFRQSLPIAGRCDLRDKKPKNFIIYHKNSVANKKYGRWQRSK